MQNISTNIFSLWIAVTTILLPFNGVSTLSNNLVTHAYQMPDSRVVSPSGDVEVVYNSEKKTAQLINRRTGIVKAKLKGHSEYIDNVAFSPDGKTIVTMGSCPDCTARLWDAKTGKKKAVLRARKWRKNILARLCTWFDECAWNGCPAVVAAFSPNSKLLITTADDATAELWDAATGKLINVISHKNLPNKEQIMQIWLAVFSPNGDTIITFDTIPGKVQQISFWDATTGQFQKSEPATSNNASAFGRKLVCNGGSTCYVNHYDY